MDKMRVLFLCTANSARSQMAEAFLRSYAGDRYEAYSAGLEPKEIHPLTKKVMDEIGIDISGQYSKSLKDYMGKIHFGYLITVCADADEKCPTISRYGAKIAMGFGRSCQIRWNRRRETKEVPSNP